MKSSEFGRGYATCLVQFWNHRSRLHEYFGRFDAVTSAELWANGASDHLYELKRPRKGVTKAEWDEAEALQSRALNIGHGFQGSSRSSLEECAGLIATAERLLVGIATLDEALAWDTAMGLRPAAGDWKCPENISRKALA